LKLTEQGPLARRSSPTWVNSGVAAAVRGLLLAEAASRLSPEPLPSKPLPKKLLSSRSFSAEGVAAQAAQ
jgi:hypothetical protein